MSGQRSNPVRLAQVAGSQIKANYSGSNTSLITDKSGANGKNTGPDPLQLLCTAVGNCMIYTIDALIGKSGADASPITAAAVGVVRRNENNRMRVQAIEVTIKLGKSVLELGDISTAIARFEEFCTVSTSIAQGFPVKARVMDSEGIVLKDDIGDGESPDAEPVVCSLGGAGCSCGCGTAG